MAGIQYVAQSQVVNSMRALLRQRPAWGEAYAVLCESLGIDAGFIGAVISPAGVKEGAAPSPRAAPVGQMVERAGNIECLDMAT
jgi:hypothetical protein